MKQYPILIFILSVFLISCNSEKESSSFEEGSFEKGEKIIEGKKDRGDTLAMPFENLIKFLPSAIGDYSAKDQGSGNTENENGISSSVAEKKYLNGEKSFKITLADYNGAYGLYAGATAIFGLGKIENSEESSRLVILKNGKWKAWESYKKQSREAVLVAGINDRFLLTIEAEGQINTELVKNIAENLDLDKLNKK